MSTALAEEFNKAGDSSYSLSFSLQFAIPYASRQKQRFPFALYETHLTTHAMTWTKNPAVCLSRCPLKTEYFLRIIFLSSGLRFFVSVIGSLLVWRLIILSTLVNEMSICTCKREHTAWGTRWLAGNCNIRNTDVIILTWFVDSAHGTIFQNEHRIFRKPNPFPSSGESLKEWLRIGRLRWIWLNHPFTWE